MPFIALTVVVLAAACGTYLISLAVRRIRTPRDLRGDWWSKFEHDFRSYAIRSAAARRRGERRRHRG